MTTRIGLLTTGESARFNLNIEDRVERDRSRLKIGAYLLDYNKIDNSILSKIRIEVKDFLKYYCVLGCLYLTHRISKLNDQDGSALCFIGLLATIFMVYCRAKRRVDQQFSDAAYFVKNRPDLFPYVDGYYIVYYNHEQNATLLFDPTKKPRHAFSFEGTPRYPTNRDKLPCVLGHAKLIDPIDKPGACAWSFFFTRTPSASSPYKGKSELGYVFDRPIIFKCSAINEAIFFHGEVPLIVDDRLGDELENAYHKMHLEHFHGNLSDCETAIIKKIYNTVRSFMRGDDEFISYTEHMYVPIQEFLKKSKGVCRHKAFVAAYLVERAIREKFLAGKIGVSLHCCQNKHGSGHAFAVYMTPVGKIIIIDPHQDTLFSLSQIHKKPLKRYIGYFRYGGQYEADVSQARLGIPEP